VCIHQAYLDAIPQAGEIDPRCFGAPGIAFDGEDGAAGFREGKGVHAESTAKIRDGTGTESPHEFARAVAGDIKAGCLLECGILEDPGQRQIADAGSSARLEARLSRDRRDEVGGQGWVISPEGFQARRGDLRQVGEDGAQVPSLGGLEGAGPGQGSRVVEGHSPTVAARRWGLDWHSV
jgi:hypothetical protein